MYLISENNEFIPTNIHIYTYTIILQLDWPLARPGNQFCQAPTSTSSWKIFPASTSTPTLTQTSTSTKLELGTTTASACFKISQQLQESFIIAKMSVIWSNILKCKKIWWGYELITQSNKGEGHKKITLLLQISRGGRGDNVKLYELGVDCQQNLPDNLCTSPQQPKATPKLLSISRDEGIWVKDSGLMVKA